MKKLLLLVSLTILLSQSYAQVPWQNAFTDDFNRADGELGENYNPVAVNGNLEIVNNQAVAQPLGTSTMYWAVTYSENIGDDSLRLAIDFIATNESSESEIRCALMAKGGGSTEWSYGAGIDANNNLISISKYDQSGNEDLLISDAFEIDGDSIYNLEFIILQGELEMTVTEVHSGEQITLNYSDPLPLDGNQVSINGIQDPNEIIYFDNFMIDTVADNFSVKEIGNFKANVKLFPNPAKEILNISIESQKINNYTVQILGMDGRKVSETQVRNSNTTVIPIDKLSKGIYAAHIKTETASKTITFIKE